MRIARMSTLLLATVMASPALYGAFVTHRMETNTALLRLLIAVPVAAVMLSLLGMVTKNFGKEPRPVHADSGPLHAEVIAGEPLARRAGD